MTTRPPPRMIGLEEILNSMEEHFRATPWNTTLKAFDSWGQPLCLHPEQQAERERQVAEAERARQQAAPASES